MELSPLKYYTVDRDIFAGTIFRLQFFLRSLNFVARLIGTKIRIGRRTLRKLFHVFNFHRKGLSTKILRSTVIWYSCIT